MTVCTFPVTLVEVVRSFSKLRNLLKTWQKSTIVQERLDSLARLSIEHTSCHFYLRRCY